VLGFVIGYSPVMWIRGEPASALQIVVAIVGGGILAAVGYTMFKLPCTLPAASWGS